MPFTMRGALPPSPTPNDEMDLDSPRSSSAGPVWPQPYQRPQYQQYHHHIQQQQQPPSPPPQHHQQLTPQSTPRQLPQDMAQSSPPGAYKGLDPSKVAAALEVARDSPDGAQDPEVSGTLESALSQIWNRVLAQPDSYVMTKGEFAVFNLYQHLFLGNQLATAARRRFWDNTHG